MILFILSEMSILGNIHLASPKERINSIFGLLRDFNVDFCFDQDYILVFNYFKCTLLIYLLMNVSKIFQSIH